MAQLTSRHMTPRPNKRALTKLEHAPTVVSGRYSIGCCSEWRKTCQHTEAWGWWAHAWNTFSPHSHAGKHFFSNKNNTPLSEQEAAQGTVFISSFLQYSTLTSI